MAGVYSHLFYLIILIISLSGLAHLDEKFQLVFWQNARAAAKVLLVGVILFAAWDVCGITLGVFYSGHSQYMSNLYFGPNFPIEELLFLVVLNYTPMLIYEALSRRRHV